MPHCRDTTLHGKHPVIFANDIHTYLEAIFLQQGMKLPTTDARAGAKKSELLWKSRKVRRGVAAMVASTKESSEALAPDYSPPPSTADGLGAEETPKPAAEPRQDQGESPPAESFKPSNLFDIAGSDAPNVIAAGDSVVPALAPSMPLFDGAHSSPMRTFSLFGLPVPDCPPPLKRRKKGPKSAPSEDIYVRTGAARCLQAFFDREAEEQEAARRAAEATDETSGSDVSSNTAEVQSPTASSVSDMHAWRLLEPSKRPVIAAGIERDAWDVISQTVPAQGRAQDLPRLESQADATVRIAPGSSPGESSARTFPNLLRTPDAETRAWAAASASALELSQPRTRFPGSPMVATMKPLSKRKLRLGESESKHKSRLFSPYAASGSTPSSSLRNMR